MNEARSRITGSEMEWSAYVRKKNEKYFRPIWWTEATTVFQQYKPETIKTIGRMATNGGCMYVDVGDHPEYATPEDDSIMGTVANEIAGERVVFDSFVNAKKDGLFEDFKLNKRVIDDEDHTWGYHVNFCSPAAKMQIDTKTLYALGVHLATMSVYAGAGTARVNRDGRVEHKVAQKSLTANVDAAVGSYESISLHDDYRIIPNPVISLRDQPLAGQEWKRVHATILDPTQSPWASMMRFGTISLVLGLIENGYRGEGLRLNAPLKTIARQTAHDDKLASVYTLSDGTTITALGIQESLLQRAQKIAAKRGVSPEEQKVLNEWQSAVDDLRTDPELMFDRADWVARRRVLRHDLDNNPVRKSELPKKVSQIDRQFDNINTNREYGELGIGQLLRGKAWKAHMPEAELIDFRYHNPPQTTRAKTRSEFIDHFHDDSNATADWEVIATQVGGRAVSMTLDNPHDVTQHYTKWYTGSND